jgi:hypothetical protein
MDTKVRSPMLKKLFSRYFTAPCMYEVCMQWPNFTIATAGLLSRRLIHRAQQHSETPHQPNSRKPKSRQDSDASQECANSKHHQTSPHRSDLTQQSSSTAPVSSSSDSSGPLTDQTSPLVTRCWRKTLRGRTMFFCAPISPPRPSQRGFTWIKPHFEYRSGASSTCVHTPRLNQ